MILIVQTFGLIAVLAAENRRAHNKCSSFKLRPCLGLLHQYNIRMATLMTMTKQPFREVLSPPVSFILIIYSTATPGYGLQHIARGAKLRKTLASTLPFGPKTISESREKFQWIECRKPNHAIAQVHGSTRQLPWFSSATSMVQL